MTVEVEAAVEVEVVVIDAVVEVEVEIIVIGTLNGQDLVPILRQENIEIDAGQGKQL